MKHEPNELDDPIENQYDPANHHLAQEIIIPAVANRRSGPQPRAVEVEDDFCHYPHGNLEAVMLHAWDDVNKVPIIVTPAMLAGSGGGSAGTKFLEEHIASNSPSLDFKASISSAYDEYVIKIYNLVLNSIDYPAIQFSTDGGATWDTSNSYSAAFSYAVNNSSSPFAFNQNTGPASPISLGINSNGSITVNLYNPLSTIGKMFTCSFAVNGTSPLMTGSGGGAYIGTSPVNAFRIKPLGSSVFVSGIARCYGLNKT